MSEDELCDAFQLSSLDDGLDRATVDSLRQKYGANELSSKDPPKIWERWLEQFREPMNALLIGSAVVSVLVGQVDDAVCISLALAIVITVGVVQEYRSEKSLDALNSLVPPSCHLRRDRHNQDVLASDLVPGDVVQLRIGDRVPADLRMVECSDLELDESMLTGETQLIKKSAKAGDDEDNLAYMGTTVQRGSGVGVVYATAEKTEFGGIFGMVDDVSDRQTPMQHAMSELAQRLSTISLVIIAVIMLIGAWQNQSWLEMFTMAVSLAVAAIPEGLPIVVTVTLALGALDMSKKKAIAKRLPSVETLGCMSVICSDKTGTLTTGEMQVTEVYTVSDGRTKLDDVRDGSDAQRRCFEVGFFCNNSYRTDEGSVVGGATEKALFEAPDAAGVGLDSDAWTREKEEPFNSETKCMLVTGHGGKGTPGQATLLKGAPEVVLDRCKAYLAADGSKSLSKDVRDKVMDQVHAMSDDGLRVLAMAYAPQHGAMTFCGLQGMHDPPRDGVENALAQLQQSGVQVVMITGDASTTARAIARKIGIVAADQVLSGEDIDKMNDRQLQDKVLQVGVYARTKPKHKLRIVSALQARGAVVGMTGDGVNDAPALKLADVGVAMGDGTDVTKEAADVILVDNNFATVLGAVRGGKTIFYNIQNFVAFQLSTSAAALCLISFSAVLGRQFPLNAMQILFVNILMDGPPSQSLGVDPPNEMVMRRPPRRKDAPVLTTELMLRTAFSALLMMALTQLTIVTQHSPLGPTQRDSTLTFSCFVFLALVSALQNRGLHTGLLENHTLLLTLAGSAALQMLIMYVPLLQRIFQTVALGRKDLVYLAGCSVVAFGLQELRRIYERYSESCDDDAHSEA